MSTQLQDAARRAWAQAAAQAHLDGRAVYLLGTRRAADPWGVQDAHRATQYEAQHRIHTGGQP